MAKTHELLTVQEAAEYLRVSVSWLHQLRQNDAGPVSWLDHARVVYPRAGLDEYRARQRKRSMRGGDGTVTA